MKNVRYQSRIPLINALRRAFSISIKSEKKGMPPLDELIEINAENHVHRRRFLGDVLKTGVVIGAASFLDACRKVSESMPPERIIQPRIVIIGAGIAGLNCAYQLKKSGYDSTIYEGSTRSGGRIFTGKNILATGLTTEMGGEFIDSGHSDMMQLCDEFGISLIDMQSQPESNLANDSFYIDGRFYTETAVIKAFQPYASRIATDIDSLPVNMTYDDYDDNTLKFDTMSIHEYLDSIGMTGFIRKGLEVAYLTEYGMEADMQSSINFLYLFSPDTADGFNLFGESDERYKVDGGNQTVTDALHKVMGNKINLDQKLVRITENASEYLLYFTNSDGTTISVSADIIVSAIPFTMLRNVEMGLTLPDWKTNAIKNLTYGTNSKLLLGFNVRAWHNHKYSGYSFTNSVLQSGWDNSVGQPGKSGGYTVYQGGNSGVELGKDTPDQQATKFVAQLQKMWPGTGPSFNGKVKRMHWPSYPFTRGSYSCYKVGQYTSIRGAEIKPVNNFYFAGEHCSLLNQGFMNGGAETGRMAAEAIIKTFK